jgi:transposase
MERYVGLDVHAKSCTAAVIDARGKQLSSTVLETNGRALVELLRGQQGRVHLCLEEGTQSGWLSEILAPHVFEMVVAHVSQSRGPKDDKRDAFALAEQLRIGAIKRGVYKAVGPYGTLRQLVKVHSMVVRDTVRIQNRIKALFRSRGVTVAGKAMYSEAKRQELEAKLPSSCRAAAQILYAQYDASNEVRKQACKQLLAESHRHPISRVLETAPGVGPIRAAQILAVVVTPERFRTRSQLWAYSGLGIVQRSSSDWIRDSKGGWVRAQVQATRGLNRNHNSMLKAVFKGAATTVVAQHRDSPLGQDYERLLAHGTKPNLAKLTIARKIAATVLAMWKAKEAYDPTKHTKSS